MTSNENIAQDDHVVELVHEAVVRQAHLARLSNETGAEGEKHLIAELDDLLPRPSGAALKVLLAALQETGVSIAGTAFDAVLLPNGDPLDFSDPDEVRRRLPEMTFVEIKSTKKDAVKPDFSGFFFSLTEKEIDAARQLRERHIVLLHNRLTGALLQTTVGDIAAKSRSTTWQVSVLL